MHGLMRMVVVNLLLICGAIHIGATVAHAIEWGAPFGFLDAPPVPDNYADLGNEWNVVGSRWAYWEYIETVPGVYDWSAIDLTRLQQMDALGVRVIPELRSNNPLYGTYWNGDEYPDGNVGAWEDFVTALVEKFDGDGVDDLQGAPTIKAYSFLHELPLPAGPGYWRDHPDEYAEMFDATYRAMKTACPDCVLFLPGSTSLGEFEFQAEGAPVDGWIVVVLGYLDGYATQFDDLGFNYHLWSVATSFDDPYSEGTDYRRHQTLIDAIRHCYDRFGYANRPIICRESGMSGIGPGETTRPGTPLQPNEPYQARYVAKIYALIGSLEQKVCAWTTTLEYTSSPAEFFLHTGLIHNPLNNGGLSHKKLAWYTYKKMTETLGGADWANVVTLIDGVDNVYAYRLDVAGQSVYVVWWDYFNDPGYTPGDTMDLVLSGLSGMSADVTDLVPDYSDGLDLVNSGASYDTAFTITNYTITAGTVTIPLGEDPVIMEVSGSAAIPAVSVWGMFLMTLLMLTMGTIVVRRGTESKTMRRKTPISSTTATLVAILLGCHIVPAQAEVYQPNTVHDVDLLGNGNIVVTDGGSLADPTTGGIYEIDRDGAMLWNSDDVTPSDGSGFDYPPLWYPCKHGVDLVNLATRGDSPWTRVNGLPLDNSPNATYGRDNPPTYYSATWQTHPGEWQRVIAEIAAKPVLRRTDLRDVGWKELLR